MVVVDERVVVGVGVGLFLPMPGCCDLFGNAEGGGEAAIFSLLVLWVVSAHVLGSIVGAC